MSTEDLLKRIWPLIPHSAGTWEQLWELTLDGLEQLPTALVRFIPDKQYPVDIEDWDYPPERAAGLKTCLDANGSDKAQENQYHKFYDPVVAGHRFTFTKPQMSHTARWFRVHVRSASSWKLE